MEKLSLEKAKSLVWTTWITVLISGGVTVFAINTKMWLLLALALLVMLWVIIRFFGKSKYMPKKTYSIVPTIFLPSAFFSLIIALVLICKSSGEITMLSIGLGILCIAFGLLSIAEARY